ncbi:prolipoprotein diacylglyceryl transferase [Tellurirhabdus rosea]|uniref:prolipoprotein diacylglyceryl transferase n=1 Tax=Tellurirhabdus rosea TaxID=2674997 RepID=UPI00225276A2|nr:prolipoprotein diacylglyceryl transferase [Tellurirhabdus rosea]
MLSYIIWDVKPEIFEIGSFAVRWYGLLFALGFLVGQQIMIHVFKKEGKPLADIDALTLYMVIATVIGARFGHFLFYEPEVLFSDPLKVILPPYAGLASHGGAIGIITGLFLYARSRRGSGQTFLWVADRIAITAALGGCFIRLGNLMNSEIIGIPTTVPWGFVFINDPTSLQTGNPAFDIVRATVFDERLGGFVNRLVTARHPAQLYEALSCLVLFFILFWFWNSRKARTPRGSMVGIFMIWIFGLRFFYEFLKEDQVAFEQNLTLNMGQILSIPAALFGLFLLVRSTWNPVSKEEKVKMP